MSIGRIRIFKWTSSELLKVLGVCFSSLGIRDVSYYLQARRTKQSLASSKLAIDTLHSIGRAGNVRMYRRAVIL